MNETMRHDQLTDELLERLTLYSLDLLDKEDASEIERHLAQGCPACSREVAELRETFSNAMVASVPIERPPDRLRERILAAAREDAPKPRVRKHWEPIPGEPLHVVRRDEGRWHTVAPGVAARRLYLDKEQASITTLLRMEPGATYQPHRHAGPEQCYVLEGDVFDGVNTYYAGDYQCAAKDSVHGVQSTKNGCLLLIISCLHDQMLA